MLGRYINPETYAIEADASSASYPLALAAISGGKVSVNIATPKEDNISLQGDSQFIHLLRQMGCTITVSSVFFGCTPLGVDPHLKQYHLNPLVVLIDHSCSQYPRVVDG